MRAWIFRILGVIVLVVGGLASEQEDVQVYATFEVQAVQSALLSLSANGVVEEIFVAVGSVVQKGDKLLSLRARELRENVEVARVGVESLRVKHHFLSKQFARYEQSKEVLDLNTFEKVQAEYKASSFELQRAEANYALQRELLENTILYAPFSGVITQKFVEVGDGVAAISSKVFALESLQKKAVVAFDSRYFGMVKVGDTFLYKINGVLQDSKLTLHKIYPSIDKHTKKAVAESLLQDSIPSGIFGDGVIVLKGQ